MGKEVSKKARMYTGQLITSETYNNFTAEERGFWNTAYKSFRQGKFYFKHKGKEYIVPFRLADGSFNTVMHKEVFEEKYGKEKIKIENKNDSNGQSTATDTLVIGSE